jgi:hypothetical protein
MLDPVAAGEIETEKQQMCHGTSPGTFLSKQSASGTNRAIPGICYLLWGKAGYNLRDNISQRRVCKPCLQMGVQDRDQSKLASGTGCQWQYII